MPLQQQGSLRCSFENTSSAALPGCCSRQWRPRARGAEVAPRRPSSAPTRDLLAQRRRQGQAAARPGLAAAATAAAAWACLLAPAQATLVVPPGNPYIVYPDDNDALKTGEEKEEEFCSEDFKGGDALEDSRADRKEDLMSAVGGDNIIKKIMTQAKSSDDLQKQLENELTVGWLISKAGPIVSLFIMLFVYLICCWTWCPCCRCCRCCVKERRTLVLTKCIGWVVVALLFVGMVICGSLAAAGYTAAVEGFDNMACTSAKFMSTMLGGRASPPFIGMIPMLTEVHEVSGLLASDSKFMGDLMDIIDKTESIDVAVKVASNTLALLSDVMSDPRNVYPGGQDEDHKCELCVVLPPILDPVVVALDDGIASMLAGVRTEIKTQITAGGGSDLRGTFDKAANPLVEVKNMIRDTFGGLVSGDEIENIRDILKQLKGGVAIILVWALLLGIIAFLAFFCFLCKEKWNQKIEMKLPTDDAEVEPGTINLPKKNPYNMWVPRLACCNWCCGFCLVMLSFFVGGLLVMLAVPLSGFCLVLDDLNGDLLLDMMPALDMNMSNGGDVDVITGIIDSCLAGQGKTQNLLEIITITNDTGSKNTMRAETVDKVKDTITGQFDEIDKLLNDPNTVKLADNQDVVKLRHMLRDNGIDTMMVPADPVAFAQKLDYNIMLTAGDIGAAYEPMNKFAATSLACESHTPVGIDNFDTEIPGLEPFETALQATGNGPIFSGVTTCNLQVRKAQCPLSSANRALCQAGNQFIDQKIALRNSNVYKCNVFKDPNNRALACDPLNMQKVNGKWVNDCMTKADGQQVEMQTKVVDCNLEDFTDYVKKFDQRIKKVLERCDLDVDTTQDQIIVDMRRLVDDYVISAIDRLADGATCGFLQTIYRELIDGFCYQGVWGFSTIAKSYVACAVLALLLIIVMYAVWRRSIDNVNKWNAKATQVAPTG